MGFGHRVYKSYDPRATLIKQVADEVFEQTGLNPKLEIALELERIALEDEYFIKRKLYPNVDFYSGLIYQAMGYPTGLLHGALRPRPAARLDRAVGRRCSTIPSRRSHGRGRRTSATTCATSCHSRPVKGLAVRPDPVCTSESRKPRMAPAKPTAGEERVRPRRPDRARPLRTVVRRPAAETIGPKLKVRQNLVSRQ